MNARVSLLLALTLCIIGSLCSLAEMHGLSAVAWMWSGAFGYRAGTTWDDDGHLPTPRRKGQ